MYIQSKLVYGNIDIVISILCCVLTTSMFCLLEPYTIHWFIIPVTACGILCMIEILWWLKTRSDLFDPVGIIAFLGLHFFYLSPLLHVYSGHYMKYVIPPSDWRPWMGYMSIINFFGILIFKFIRNATFRHFIKPEKSLALWDIKSPLFFRIIITLSLLSILLQISVYYHFGGIDGYISAFERRGEFVGFGIIFLVSEAFPILFIMWYAAFTKTRNKLPSWTNLILILFIFFIIQMIFGGLRGSRSNVIWGLFWALGILHYYVRPVPWRMTVLGITFLITFMYGYGFYKSHGLEGILSIDSRESLVDLELRSGRSLESLLLGDLSRSDVQAYILYRLWNQPSQYDYAWGRTYIGTISLLVPQYFWPDRPPTKVKEGTDLLYGHNSFPTYRASNVYGLSGEFMLNFGYWLAPLAFSLLGFIVGFFRGLLYRLRPGDLRLLLAPFFIILTFSALVSDSDNLLFSIIKNLTFPAIPILLAHNRSDDGSSFLHQLH